MRPTWIWILLFVMTSYPALPQEVSSTDITETLTESHDSLGEVKEEWIQELKGFLGAANLSAWSNDETLCIEPVNAGHKVTYRDVQLIWNLNYKMLVSYSDNLIQDLRCPLAGDDQIRASIVSVLEAYKNIAWSAPKITDISTPFDPLKYVSHFKTEAHAVIDGIRVLRSYINITSSRDGKIMFITAKLPTFPLEKSIQSPFPDDSVIEQARNKIMNLRPGKIEEIEKVYVYKRKKGLVACILFSCLHPKTGHNQYIYNCEDDTIYED